MHYRVLPSNGNVPSLAVPIPGNRNKLNFIKIIGYENCNINDTGFCKIAGRNGNGKNNNTDLSEIVTKKGNGNAGK